MKILGVRFLERLDGRIALVLFISFMIIGLFATLLFMKSSRDYQQNIVQVMHADLAEHVIDHYLLFKRGKPDLKAAKDTFHDLMILGPNFEFYVLDQNGTILAFSTKPEKIKRKFVSLEPIQAYLSQPELRQPLHGDDPRSPVRQKVFSVAPIVDGDVVQGYLYVILGSEIYDGIDDMLRDNQTMRWSLGLLLAGLIFGLITAVINTRAITSPMRKLTRQVEILKQRGFSSDELDRQSTTQALAEWDHLSKNEIHTVGSAFSDAVEILKAQYANVVSVDEMRRELLSHVSHDLRTPLASLLGYLETWQLNQDKLSKEQSRSYIRTAIRNAKRISALVEQLFELAYLDSGDVKINLENVVVAELVQDVLQKFQIIAEKRQVSLSVEPKDSSITVVADMEKLDRVFTNLIENALRHTQPGGCVNIKLSKSSSLVAIEVSDTGIGIPAKDIEKIFDPHFKAENSVRGNTAHGGLGLAITRKLLALHESKIQVSSVINQGTKFTFSLASQASLITR